MLVWWVPAVAEVLTKTIEGGTRLEVAWTSPDGPGDNLTITPAGSVVGT